PAPLVLPFYPYLVVALGDRGFALGNARSELRVAGNPLLAAAGERRSAKRGIAQGPNRAGLHSAIVEGPFADVDFSEPDLDEVAGWRRERLARAQGAVELGKLLLPVVDVEAHDQIGVPKRCLVHGQAQRVLVGKVECAVDVPHRRAGGLGQFHEALEAARTPAG